MLGLTYVSRIVALYIKDKKYLLVKPDVHISQSWLWRWVPRYRFSVCIVTACITTQRQKAHSTIFSQLSYGKRITHNPAVESDKEIVGGPSRHCSICVVSIVVFDGVSSPDYYSE